MSKKIFTKFATSHIASITNFSTSWKAEHFIVHLTLGQWLRLSMGMVPFRLYHIYLTKLSQKIKLFHMFMVHKVNFRTDSLTCVHSKFIVNTK